MTYLEGSRNSRNKTNSQEFISAVIISSWIHNASWGEVKMSSATAVIRLAALSILLSTVQQFTVLTVISYLLGGQRFHLLPKYFSFFDSGVRLSSSNDVSLCVLYTTLPNLLRATFRLTLCKYNINFRRLSKCYHVPGKNSSQVLQLAHTIEGTQ